MSIEKLLATTPICIALTVHSIGRLALKRPETIALLYTGFG